MTELPPLKPEFIQSLEERFGPSYGRALAASLDTPPSVSLRLNSRKTARIALGADDAIKWLYEGMRPVPWAKGGFWLAERPQFSLHPWIHAGGFYVQEAASMYMSALMENIRRTLRAEGRDDTRLRVLDLCAAPGGKSIAAAEALPDTALIVSNEVVPERAAVLKENVVKWGHPNHLVTSAGAAEWGRAEGFFDILIVDAPCSGEGMMRKEPVARTQWSTTLAEECSALQKTILADALPALKPGGWLVYSTCTFNRHEDEENAEWLCRESGLEPIGSPRMFTPLSDGTEGLFMALMRKPFEEPMHPGQTDTAAAKSHAGKRRKPTASQKEGIPKELKLTASSWLLPGTGLKLYESGNKLTARSEDAQRLLDMTASRVRVLVSGIELGEAKGRDIVPSHHLAMQTVLDPGAFPRVELVLPEAQSYLRRDTPSLAAGAPHGYVILTYGGLPLGFVKNIGSRANNLYPLGWRLRK